MVNRDLEYYQELVKEYNCDLNLLLQLCNKYNIDPIIPIKYIQTIKSEGNYYQNLQCGTGKTIGLAIAAKVVPDLSFNYVASTHSRLREFVDTLLRLQVNHYYLTASRLVINDYSVVQASRIIILTSSMLLQFDYSKIEYFIRGSKYNYRPLIIDELPKIILQVLYDLKSWNLFTKNLPKSYNYSKCSSVSDLFSNEDLYVTFDEALNSVPKGNSEYLKKAFYSKLHILKRLSEKNYPQPKDYSDNLDEFEYNVAYLSIFDVYLSKAKTTIILDATSDLYYEVLSSKPMFPHVTRDYSSFIEDCYYMHLNYGFKQRDNIINNLIKYIKSFLPELFKLEGPYYLATHNSSVYDGMGEEKVVQDDIMNQFKQIFKQVYTNDNKDFILCRSSDNEIKLDDFGRVLAEDTDLFISNYGRSRGSNYFRDCRTVWLLGSFFLPDNELRQMLNDTSINLDYKRLQTNLAIADGVQEISRGCIRKRKIDEKMNIIMMGDIKVLKGIIDYMGINNAIKMN